ncbi:hypothetical protein K502DRAFT_351713 [Neoconidiobolus thromboides FSU 785]|nr:hypothetical protein K502DRAFT_351713 [Neoconidiobolus thromboides FSU 785]
MSLLQSIILLITLISLLPTSVSTTINEQLSTECNLEKNSGKCKAIHHKYYYDKTARKCKSFIWGGCEGQVPFDNLEDCKQTCMDKIKSNRNLSSVVSRIVGYLQ